jgi:prophage antirepressor-like protein
MQEIIPFLFQNDQLVRSIAIDGEPWFVAADVCRVLGLRNTPQAVSRLDADERETIITNDGFRGPGTIIVSEPGVYGLILTSRKPQAVAFKRWLKHDVIPALRKTGRFELAAGEILRKNAMAMNAACRAVAEIRRAQGTRAASDALPDIFARAGITIGRKEPPQREFGFSRSAEADDDKVVEIVPGARIVEDDAG